MPIMQIIVVGSFLLMLGAALFYKIKAMLLWLDNSRQPITQVRAKVVDKRIKSIARADKPSKVRPMRNWYYITFETSSKKTIELAVQGADYADIEIGDTGTLRYQGTWFTSFSNQSRHS